ncbi:MAG TPA: serine/threonine-protein kinase [Phycisphaerae bacterium]
MIETNHTAPPRQIPQIRGLTIRRFIDRGGFADVWLAQDEAGYLIVKRVRREVTERELEALRLYKQLADDPVIGLLPIQHIGRCESGELYFTMPPADPLHERTFDPEQYEPGSLAAIITLRQRLAPDEALRVARDVLPALAHLHERGLIHRDIKPRNILRYHGRWCLADTGLMTREDRVGLSTAGTPQYQPPNEDLVDRSTDLYALGKTLYAALNGSIEDFPVPDPQHLRAGRARGEYSRIYRVIARACAVEPAQRYTSAQAMLVDLGMVAPAPARTLWRNSAIIAAGLVLAISVWTYWHGRESATPSAPASNQWTIPPELSIKFKTPGDSNFREYAPHARLHPGDSFYVEAALPPGSDACLVLATYVQGQRSVLHYAPTSQEMIGRQRICRFGHSVERDGKLNGFELPQESAPLLVLLFASDKPVSGARAEAAVESALSDIGGWPTSIDAFECSALASMHPMRIQGSTIVPWAEEDTTRGGPPLARGESVPPLPARRIVDALANEFGSVYGVWTTIGQ